MPRSSGTGSRVKQRRTSGRDDCDDTAGKVCFALQALPGQQRRNRAGEQSDCGDNKERARCGTLAPGPLLVVAAVGLLACAVSALLSWRSLKGEADLSRRVVAIVSTGCATLFGLAILFPMIAALVLPPCFG